MTTTQEVEHGPRAHYPVRRRSIPRRELRLAPGNHTLDAVVLCSDSSIPHDGIPFEGTLRWSAEAAKSYCVEFHTDGPFHFVLKDAATEENLDVCRAKARTEKLVEESFFSDSLLDFSPREFVFEPWTRLTVGEARKYDFFAKIKREDDCSCGWTAKGEDNDL